MLDFGPILSGPNILDAKDALDDLVLRLLSATDERMTVDPTVGPSEVLFKGKCSSCVTPSFSSFLNCLPRRPGEPSFKLLR